jgi:alpha-amylase
VLDNDNPLKGGYRNPTQLVTLLDNHDIEKRIMSHARTRHTGNDGGLKFAIRVTKLCLGALFTMRGIPQLYYGTEIGLEGWKVEGAYGDRDLRRDFPWEIIGENNQPKDNFAKEKEIYQWTRDLIALRKKCKAFRSGTTITLWSDRFVYAFLRVSTDDLAFIIINNGYEPMPQPIQIPLNRLALPERVIAKIRGNLTHWQTGDVLLVVNDLINVKTEGKAIDIFVS